MQEMLNEYLPIVIFLGLAIALGLILILAAAIVAAVVALAAVDLPNNMGFILAILSGIATGAILERSP